MKTLDELLMKEHEYRAVLQLAQETICGEWCTTVSHIPECITITKVLAEEETHSALPSSSSPKP